MKTIGCKRHVLVAAPVLLFAHYAPAQLPNHPVLTEVYTDPNGANDGPVGRDVTNLHQEYIEIYLPPASSLSTSLMSFKDALRLTFYEVEGDANSGGNGLVNYRFDLPTFDLDSTNGITAGAIARPSSGVVVLGWVDYTSTSPVVLAGTPSTRVAMINGGITTTGGTYTFIAMNGAQGTGTTNFPVPTAENLIDLPAEAGSGVIQNGSGVYLLVHRDAASGYVMLCDDQHLGDCPDGADPKLPDDSAGAGLNTPAHLDGFAPQDDVVAGDLQTVLTPGGAFTPLIPQVLELDDLSTYPGTANGYARLFIDVRKTTEDGAVPDDPLVDAGAYRHIRNNGPFFPTPGRAVLTTTAPELGVAVAAEHTLEVLAQTTARPRVVTANVGGDYPINITASPGGSSNPSAATFAAGQAANSVPGQTLGFPTVAVTGAAGAANNATASSTITVTATNAVGGQPPVVTPIQMTTMTATVLNPTTGLRVVSVGPPLVTEPFQTTVFAAIQGIPADAGVLNEFLTTSLGAYVANNLGGVVQDAHFNGSTLINPATDIGNGPTVMQPMAEGFAFPDPGFFINSPGAPGKLDLLQTVEQSAEVVSGATTYNGNFDSMGVRARRVTIADTLAFGGPFTPTEALHFVDATGRAGTVRSGLTNATTTRTFELAILDTNTKDLPPPLDPYALETGANDDFGIIIEVASTEPGAPVVTDEFVFLSFTGGLQGTDIDGVEVPPGNNVANILYLDLDNLHTVLGIRTIKRIIPVDAGATGNLDAVEVFSLNPVAPAGCQPPDCNDGNPCTTDSCVSNVCEHMNNTEPCDDGLFCNGADNCSGGTCSQHVGDPCPGPDGDADCAESCDETSNNCTATDPNGSACNDGLFCTFPDTCSSASCVGGGGTPCIDPANCDEGTNTCTGETPPANDIVWDPAKKSCTNPGADPTKACTVDADCGICTLKKCSGLPANSTCTGSGTTGTCPLKQCSGAPGNITCTGTGQGTCSNDKYCSGLPANTLCTGTGQGTCPAGQTCLNQTCDFTGQTCDFVDCVTTADQCTPVSAGTCTAGPPGVCLAWPNNNPAATTRSLRFTVEGPAGPSKPEAIKVTMVDLQHPNPPNLPLQAPTNMTTYDTKLNSTCAGATASPNYNGHHCDVTADCDIASGTAANDGTCTGQVGCTADPPCTDPLDCTLPSNSCSRWVGKLGTFYEAQGPPQSGPYKAARLQCTPYYFDWKPEGLITVVGGDIAPSSEYSVEVYGTSCIGAEDGCIAVSSPVTMYTRRSGDVEVPFNPPSAEGQPNVTDIAQLVNKVKSLPGAPVKAISQLQPNLPEMNTNINVSDIVAVVDAVKLFKYPYSGPCPCPSLSACGVLGCATDTACRNSGLSGLGAGALCVKTCAGPGPLTGEPCLDNTHCVGSGTCGSGFCRDRCGRCTP